MKSFMLLPLFLLSVFLLSCDKNVSKESILGQWEVISLYRDKNYEKGDLYYVLNFKKDNTVSLSLDVNGCGTNYSKSCDNCISFEPFVCTQICCDSDYSIKLIEVISESKEYEINSDILTLKSLGEVKLKRIFK